jgi:hypothetical protein
MVPWVWLGSWYPPDGGGISELWAPHEGEAWYATANGVSHVSGEQVFRFGHSYFGDHAEIRGIHSSDDGTVVASGNGLWVHQDQTWAHSPLAVSGDTSLAVVLSANEAYAVVGSCDGSAVCAATYWDAGPLTVQHPDSVPRVLRWDGVRWLDTRLELEASQSYLIERGGRTFLAHDQGVLVFDDGEWAPVLSVGRPSVPPQIMAAVDADGGGFFGRRERVWTVWHSEGSEESSRTLFEIPEPGPAGLNKSGDSGWMHSFEPDEVTVVTNSGGWRWTPEGGLEHLFEWHIDDGPDWAGEVVAIGPDELVFNNATGTLPTALWAWKGGSTTERLSDIQVHAYHLGGADGEVLVAALGTGFRHGSLAGDLPPATDFDVIEPLGDALVASGYAHHVPWQLRGEVWDDWAVPTPDFDFVGRLSMLDRYTGVWAIPEADDTRIWTWSEDGQLERGVVLPGQVREIWAVPRDRSIGVLLDGGGVWSGPLGALAKVEAPEVLGNTWLSAAAGWDTVWLGGAGGVLARLDGVGWTAMETGFGFDVDVVAGDGSGRAWWGAGDTLYRPTGPDSWTQVEGVDLTDAIAFSGADDGRLWVLLPERVLVVSDTEALDLPLPDERWADIAAEEGGTAVVVGDSGAVVRVSSHGS